MSGQRWALLRSARALPVFVALGAGCLITIMTHSNGVLNHLGGPVFTAWSVHVIGTVTALGALAVLPRGNASDREPAPAWAFIGGFFGVLLVMMASEAVNSPLALSGTLAIGLAGQMAFSLAGDYWGFFGLARRRLGLRELLAAALITAGCAILIVFGRGAG